MQFTDEQRIAIKEHGQNLVLVAGAGSGKTRVLVERFIHLLQENPDWALTDLVAITFTEKAAREMRERVRAAISGRVAASAGSPEQSRWRNHETLLDSARIGTIHALCARLLRSNPAPLGIDPQFEVLDEAAAALLRYDAAQRALQSLVKQDVPALELLVHYDPNQVERLLPRFVGREASEHLAAFLQRHATPAALYEYWGELCRAANAEAIAALREDTEFQEALWWEPNCSDFGDKLFAHWQSVMEWREPFLHGDEQEAKDALSVFSKIKLTVGSKNNWDGEEGLREAKNKLGWIRDRAKEVASTLLPPLSDHDSQAAHYLFLWGALVAEAASHYQEMKAERGVLDFEDLEGLAVKLLCEFPEVAQHYATEEFRHVMVDEFQDTNPNQRRIIYQLCGIDIDSAQAGQPGRLFVVGDPKQSIYAFRGADVSVFKQVREELSASGGLDLPLSLSFRSHHTLIEGLNDLFGGILGQASAQGYEVGLDQPMRAHRPSSQPQYETPIEVILMPKSQDGDTIPTEELRSWEAYEIARRIQRHVEEGSPVYDKELGDYRPFRYGDAAILFRAFTDVPKYETVFKALGLPYVTLAGKGYYDRQEVWDLLNLLKALHNHADHLALATALRSPLFGFSDEGLFILRQARDAETQAILPLWDAVQQAAAGALHLALPLNEADQRALHFAAQCLAELQAMAGRVAVVDLLAAILDMTAYDAILSALPDGDRRRGNVEKLLHKARESGRVGLSDFNYYLGELSAVDPREGEAALESQNAIKIMTIHASKGLEFPLVVLADCGRGKNSSSNNTALLKLDAEIGAACQVMEDGELQKPFAFSYSKHLADRREAAEEKRLLYVAATRAQDYLIFSGSNKANTWMQQICDVWGIEAEGDYNLGWGTLRVVVPTIRPQKSELSPRPARQQNGWQVLGRQHYAPLKPPLLETLPPPQPDSRRHISATQLEYLGNQAALGRRLFRQSVLHDAPLPLRPLVINRHPRIQRLIIGRIVHRALQVGAWHHPERLHNSLEAYAWEEGITNRQERSQIVQDAKTLLHNFQEPDALLAADQVMREVPFVHETGPYILHGVIDVLYQSGGRWYILDYKTTILGDIPPEKYAQRYYYQVGAYAQAVAARTGETPIVQLYFLDERVYPPVEVPSADWQQAMADLDAAIRAALESPPV